MLNIRRTPSMSMTRSSVQRIESLVRQNARLARLLRSDEFGKCDLTALKKLTLESGLSIAAGEILWLNDGWYVTSRGLLRVAKDNHCSGIHAHVLTKLSDPRGNRWVFKATVYKSRYSRGFVGYGDADPSNVSPLVRGAEMRVAETRAVNRALRKAYGIGLCSVEELGSFSGPIRSVREDRKDDVPRGQKIPSNGEPRLRDRLCLLIRQHQLDPTQVKRYAADFCGTETLREASRDLVESFINNLADWAAKDREGLLCKLNSYAQSEEVHP